MIISADIRQNARLLMRMDWWALTTQVILLGTGVLFIYGAGRDYGAEPPFRWLAQLAWIVIGTALYFACALCDYRELGRKSWLLYFGGLVLLSLVFINGGHDSSARSVLRLPGADVQVSEPMKVAALFFCSYILSHPVLAFTRMPLLLLWGIVTVPPVAFVLLQGDGGTALMFLPFTFAILFINGLRKRWILAIIIALLIAVPMIFTCLKPYQKQRVLVFMKIPCENVIDVMSAVMPSEWIEKMNRRLDDTIKSFSARERGSRPLDDWNARQALYSVGSGGMSGTGFLKGRQHTLGYLPRGVAPTDFIFCVIAEESGFMGCLAVICAICLLVIFSFRTAIISRDRLGAGIATGAAVLYVTHTFVNIGMCVGWAPIIGIPLPFISYGGSCLVTMMIVAGLVQSVHARNSGVSPGSNAGIL